MKIINTSSNVEVSGAQSAPAGFNISMSSAAYSLLSDGLYTNKILAIIRELSCNAWDAHNAAGKSDVPFFVHLPTMLEPFFTITDQGTGLRYTDGGCKTCSSLGQLHPANLDTMDECQDCAGTGDYDAVKALYCTYFGTNKSDSNDFIGALGLGSKSPFCYAQGFTVTNCYNGMTRIYSCFKDRQNVPSVLLQSEEETPDAINGVSVSFPVNQKDVREFQNQAEQAWEFFEPAPTVNVQSLNIKRANYSMRTDEFGLRAYGNVRVIQGMVQYSIGNIDSSRLTRNHSDMLSAPLDIFLPIGTVDVAANRESLSNNERTIAAILSALDTVHSKVVQSTKERINACASIWDARLAMYDLENKQGVGGIVRQARKDGEFNGEDMLFPMTSKRASINLLDYPGVSLQKFECKQNRYSIVKSILIQESILQGANPELCCVELSATPGVTFVINDIEKNFEKYCRKYVSRKSDRTVYLITKLNSEYTTEQAADQGINIIGDLGNPPVLFASDLREEFKHEDAPKGPKSKPRKVLKYSYASRWSSAWSDATDTVPTGRKFYIAVKSLKPVTRRMHDVGDLGSLWQYAKNCTLIGIYNSDVLYGIQENRTKGLGPEWVDFFEFLVSEFASKVVGKKLEIAMVTMNNGTELSNGVISFVKSACKSGLFDEDHPIQVLGNSIGRKFDEKQLSNLNSLADQLTQWNAYNFPVVVDMSAEQWRAIKASYPMMRMVDDYHMNRYSETILDYIQMVDQQKQQATEFGATFASDCLVQTEEEQIHVN